MDPLSRSILSAPSVKYAGLGVLFLGLVLTIWAVLTNPESGPMRAWKSYIARLERGLRVLFIWTPGVQIATPQLIGIYLVVALAMLVGLDGWFYLVAIIAAAPLVYIELQKRKRVDEIEKQLDGFLLTMANALKATPSIGDAFISVRNLIAPPLQQEVDLAVKEMRIGSTLVQALLLMATRIGSRRVDSALSAMLIGRQVGGNLPKILETTATTLREIARLEAVVKTKTAEGRAQAFALALIPGVIIFGFNKVQPHYFDVLTQSFIGYLITIMAVAFWVGSLVWARKILAVDV